MKFWIWKFEMLKVKKVTRIGWHQIQCSELIFQKVGQTNSSKKVYYNISFWHWQGRRSGIRRLAKRAFQGAATLKTITFFVCQKQLTLFVCQKQSNFSVKQKQLPLFVCQKYIFCVCQKELPFLCAKNN